MSKTRLVVWGGFSASSAIRRVWHGDRLIWAELPSQAAFFPGTSFPFLGRNVTFLVDIKVWFFIGIASFGLAYIGSFTVICFIGS